MRAYSIAGQWVISRDLGDAREVNWVIVWFRLSWIENLHKFKSFFLWFYVVCWHEILLGSRTIHSRGWFVPEDNSFPGTTRSWTTCSRTTCSRGQLVPADNSFLRTICSRGQLVPKSLSPCSQVLGQMLCFFSDYHCQYQTKPIKFQHSIFLVPTKTASKLCFFSSPVSRNNFLGFPGLTTASQLVFFQWSTTFP